MMAEPQRAMMMMRMVVVLVAEVGSLLPGVPPRSLLASAGVGTGVCVCVIVAAAVDAADAAARLTILLGVAGAILLDGIYVDVRRPNLFVDSRLEQVVDRPPGREFGVTGVCSFGEMMVPC